MGVIRVLQHFEIAVPAFNVFAREMAVNRLLDRQHPVEAFRDCALVLSRSKERPMLAAACHAHRVSVFCMTQVQHGDDDRLHVLDETFFRSSGEVWVTSEYEHLWCLVGELTGALVKVVAR
jgi:hypothetical protein